LALHQQIWAFHQQGWPGWAIAQQLGIGKNTVFRYLRMETLPARKRRTRPRRSLLTPYTPYLLERWNAGVVTPCACFASSNRRGYPGSYATVARYAQRLRPGARGGTPTAATAPPSATRDAPPHRSLTPRRATWLVLQRPEQRTPEEEHLLAQLTVQDATLADAIALAQDFAQLVRQRQPAQLDPWLARAAESPLVPLQRVCERAARRL